MAKYHVGVGVSKHKHKECIRNLSQDSYHGVFSSDVNRHGFEKFSGTLRKLSQNKEDFVIGIEATGSYGVTLAYFPISHRYKERKPRLTALMLALWQFSSPWKITKLSLCLTRRSIISESLLAFVLI